MAPRTPYTPLSPFGRTKRALNGLDEAHVAYREIIEVSSQLTTQEDGLELLQHTQTQMGTMFILKARVREVRVGLRTEGWFASKFTPNWRHGSTSLQEKMKKLKSLEHAAKSFFLDAKNTTAKAAEIIEKSRSGDGQWRDDATTTEESDIQKALGVFGLATVVEEDVPELGGPTPTQSTFGTLTSGAEKNAL